MINLNMTFSGSKSCSFSQSVPCVTFEMYRNTLAKCKEIYKRKKERTDGKNGRMNKVTKDNCRIEYPKSKAWILKVLRKKNVLSKQFS